MWFDPGELEVFPESKKVTPSEIDRQITLAQIQTGSVMGEGMIDEEMNKFAYYVDVGLQVILVLLRLFR
jgi:hypothetical protein